MKSAVILLAILASVSVYSQKKTEGKFEPETFELMSPWIYKGAIPTPSYERHLKSCLDFVTLSHACGVQPSVSFGDRIGERWDLFHIGGGKVDRTRMVEIGKFGWNDKFTVPYVEPWPILAPGEKRTVTINASGANGSTGLGGLPGTDGVAGADGVAGMNGDGTYTPMPRKEPTVVRQPTAPTTGENYATANVKEPVSSTVKGKDGKLRSDAYNPIVEVKKDHMYAVHVLDETHDFYVLIHVDDMEHGEHVRLSFVKLDPAALKREKL